MTEQPDQSHEDRPVFDNHFVLYLDFLGVSEAASSWEDERAASLIELLTTIAAARAPFTMDGAAQPDGSYKITATAETSTFSDHVVASYPIPDQDVIPIELVMDMFLSLSQDFVGKVAAKALDIGLLVRGGITSGKLYHSDGVVFGEAMLDAYRLESQVAIYPRIAVSSRIYGAIRPSERRRLLQDGDGIWHLNYFPTMLNSIEDGERQSWIDSCLDMIERNVSSFERAEKWNPLAKWSWFKNEFGKQTKA